MKKLLLLLSLLTVIISAEMLKFNDATVQVQGDFPANYQFNHTQACGDYDGDGAQDVLIVRTSTRDASSNSPTIEVYRFIIYSYKKKTCLLQFDDSFSAESHTNFFSFIDLDDDGDTELIVQNYIFDYATDGVVKKP